MNGSVLPPAIWIEEFKVHSYEVDLKRKASLETLCRFFQEAAWNHAEALGAGYSHLQQLKKFWVLSRLRLEIQRYPAWGETVTIRTWPRAAKSVFAWRDFEVVDGVGARLVGGTSGWLIIDTVSRRPQRMEKILPFVTGLSDRRATTSDPEKLPGCEVQQTRMGVAARYSDIDVNGHANNARYLGWLLDSYQVDFHRAHALRVVEVNFLGETVGGDQVVVGTQEIGFGDFCHSIAKLDGGEDVCRARMKWAADAGTAIG
jgi:acyl-ACP thioesterase